jgi:multicomponent Na+:H+ antiporter subunit G
MNAARDILTIGSVLAGVFFFVAGTAGLLRFPDSLTRLHALTKADHLGLGFVALGLVMHAPGVFLALKLTAVWLLGLLASAVVSQVLARAIARHTALE